MPLKSASEANFIARSFVAMCLKSVSEQLSRCSQMEMNRTGLNETQQVYVDINEQMCYPSGRTVRCERTRTG